MKLGPPLCLPILLLCLPPAPALAHHSFAMFDSSRTDQVSGTVKEFDMINPHGWLQLLVADPAGATREWSLETAAPAQLSRDGWQARTLSPGDKVTARLHPLRDGSNGGQLISVTLAGGQTLNAGQPRGGGFGAP